MGTPRDWLRLARAPLAATAAGDAVACALLARGPGLLRGDAPAAAPVDLLLLAATSVLVYAAGMIGNDLADRRRDATVHPDRPLPAGRVSLLAAAVAALLCAGGALALGGGPLGSTPCVGAAVALAWAYDAGVKRSLAGGAAVMGLVRVANAATAVLPLVLSGTTHPLALLGPVVLGLYSAGITVLSTAEDRPAPAPRRLLAARAAAFLAFAGAGIAALLGADGLTFGVFLASGVCLPVAFGRVPRPGPVAAQVFEMLLAFHWLEAVLAMGGFPGSAWAPTLATAGGAWALIVLAQLGRRALRPHSPAPR